MRLNQKIQTRDKERQQSAEIPHNGFGAIRLRAVAAAAGVTHKAKRPTPQRDVPPLLRKDRFFD